MSWKNKAVHGVAWYGGSRVVIQGFSWITSLIVARLLAPADFGLLAMALMFVGVVNLLNELGFGAAIVQLKEVSEEDLDTIFWFSLATSLGFYLLTALVAPLVGYFFHQTRLVPILRVLGSSFLISGLRVVPWNLLTRQMDFKRRSIAETCGTLAGTLVTFILAYVGWGVWALVVGFLVPNLVMTIQVFVQTGWKPQFRFVRASLHRSLGFSLTVVGSRILWYLQDSSDSFVIGRVLGDQALGIYNMAIRFGAELSGRFLGVILQVAFPVYSRLQNNPELMKRYFLDSSGLICTVLFPVPIGVFLVADDAIPWLLTAKWAAAVLPLKILCWSALLKTVYSLAAPLVLAKGQLGVTFRFQLLCLVVLPPCYWIGTHFGLSGVCWVWLTVFPGLVVYWLHLSQRLIGYRQVEFLRALAPALVSTLVMVIVVYLARLLMSSTIHPFTRMWMTVVMGVGAYLGCLIVGFPQAVQRLRDLVRSRGKIIPSSADAV